MKMSRNMHRLDQGARAILGILLIYYGFLDRSVVDDALLGLLLGVFGVVNLGSALMGVCPVYLLAGIRTFKGADRPH